MRFNLKKLKQCIATADELGCILRWIEGFERELREEIQKLEKSRTPHPPYTEGLTPYGEALLYVYKEILGEE